MDLGVNRQHDGGVIGGWIRVGQAATQRAAIADLRIADLTGGLGDNRTLVGEQRRRGNVVMDRRREDLDLAVLLADAGEPGNFRDVDQDARLAQAQLHQRHQAVPAGQELAPAAGLLQLLDRLVQ